MKRSKSSSNFFLLLMSLLLLLAFPLKYSSTAESLPGRLFSAPTSDDEQTPIGQTPQEIGKEEYLRLVREARNKLSALPKNMPVKFPVGVNTPIRILDKPPSNPPAQVNESVIGYINSSGQPRPFTTDDLMELFDWQIHSLNAENLGTMPEAQTPMNAVPGSNLFQGKPISAIDLIVREMQTEEIYFLPRIQMRAVFRDVLNALLNKNLTESDYDMNTIYPEEIQEFKDELERQENNTSPEVGKQANNNEYGETVKYCFEIYFSYLKAKIIFI